MKLSSRELSAMVGEHLSRPIEPNVYFMVIGTLIATNEKFYLTSWDGIREIPD